MKNIEPSTNSYRKIVSSTAVLGSAQFVNVLMNILRGKLVAVILHSAGMGIMSLLQNAANTIQQFALLGINVSAVRFISKADSEQEEASAEEKAVKAQALSTTIRIVRALVLMASCAALLFTLAISPLMSQFSFGSYEYVAFFLLLSIYIFFNIMGAGEMAVMQGLRRYRKLALCSIVPPLCGLLISVPIYYFWGNDGIVPAMIVSGIIYWIVIRKYSFHEHNGSAERRSLPLRTIWHEGQGILRLGVVMTISTIVGAITTYALMAFISNTGSVSDVGLYQAANFVAMQYINMIFTAMATDYYPRLAALIQSKEEEAHQLVNQQIEIVLLITAPLVILTILTAPLLITILLTEEFQPIRSIIYFMGLSGLLKALCFPMDYIAYAKGDKQFIFWVETVWSNIKTFSVIAAFYYVYGLKGLGYGVLTSSIIDVVVSLSLVRLRYNFTLSSLSLRILIIMLSLTCICFIATFIESSYMRYSIMALSSITCFTLCFIELNKRIDFHSLVSRFTNRKS
ncbi:oligosaccharide flippase family protein [Prevotella sp. E13-27]|uniref:oligosaccharide flippase family protein n=1 Tax=Prevotella sp. E13-27 TaxID=2938122 RepID=UPI00200AD92B|nr:oligosaccharide flippase family protein [Prevotella sp. E13-27]MCK8622704.1 oligosaccharide flippase family protein [Prevotella sp. E13-27]